MNFVIHVKDFIEDETAYISRSIPADLCGDASDSLSAYEAPLEVTAECRRSLDFLFIHLSIDTHVRAPCTICSENFVFPLHLTLNLEFDLKGEDRIETIDLVPHIREAVLLDTPLYMECSGGKCPERASLAKYLTQPAGE